MKIIKINDNLKINIEHIYSIEKKSNQSDIVDWEDSYQELIDEYSKDPPMLTIGEDEIFKPEYGANIDEQKLAKYTESLNKHIISIFVTSGSV